MPLWFLLESSRIIFGREPCQNCLSGDHLFWQNRAIPELGPEWSPEWTGTESGGMQLNRYIYLFILQLYFLSSFQILFANGTCHRHITGRLQPCASTQCHGHPHKDKLWQRQRCVSILETQVCFFSFSILFFSTDNHSDRLGIHTATIKWPWHITTDPTWTQTPWIAICLWQNQ